jgi:hypothetical protein
MILSGLLFDFDKLNNLISTKGKVPMVADFMASRWAYEALATHQFKNNEYEAPFYNYEKEEAKADFKSAFMTDELKRRNRFVMENFESKNDSVKNLVNINLTILRDNLRDEPFKPGLEKVDLEQALQSANYSKAVGMTLDAYFEEYRKHYQKIYNENVSLVEKKMAFFEKNGVDINEEKNRYQNESLSDLVKNVNVEQRLLEYQGKLIQQINPIFQEPRPTSMLDYRTAFFLPEKSFLGMTMSTYLFNIIVIWVMSLFLYIALYFEWVRKFIDLFGKVNIPGKK